MAFSTKRRVGIKRRLRAAAGLRGIGLPIPQRPSIIGLIRKTFADYLRAGPKGYRQITITDTTDIHGKLIKEFRSKIMFQFFGRQSRAAMKQFADTVLYSIPTTGSGFTFKKTKITSGAPKAPLGRLDTRASRLKLSGRRTGTAIADQQKAIRTAHAKIDRMKEERMEYLAKQGRPMFSIALGSYYGQWISPLYDSQRRNINEIIEERLSQVR